MAKAKPRVRKPRPFNMPNHLDSVESVDWSVKDGRGVCFEIGLYHSLHDPATVRRLSKWLAQAADWIDDAD